MVYLWLEQINEWNLYEHIHMLSELADHDYQMLLHFGVLFMYLLLLLFCCVAVQTPLVHFVVERA